MGFFFLVYCLYAYIFVYLGFVCAECMINDMIRGTTGMNARDEVKSIVFPGLRS